MNKLYPYTFKVEKSSTPIRAPKIIATEPYHFEIFKPITKPIEIKKSE